MEKVATPRKLSAFRTPYRVVEGFQNPTAYRVVQGCILQPDHLVVFPATPFRANSSLSATPCNIKLRLSANISAFIDKICIYIVSKPKDVIIIICLYLFIKCFNLIFVLYTKTRACSKEFRNLGYPP